MSKIIWKSGFTNEEKYIENNQFIIKKTYNGFNHLIDYKILNDFNFIPKLILNNQEFVIWKYHQSKHLNINDLTDKILWNIAKNIRIVHKSDLKFPKNNLKKRIDYYLKIINQKKINDPIINDNYRDCIKLISKMNRNNPCHNDLWYQNILINNQNEILIVDWEYATMGDKHFDLAYLIESFQLNQDQEKTFLKAYNSFDDYQAYNDEIIIKYKKFCHWLTILWAYAQSKLPFSIDENRNKINKINKILNK